MKYAVMYLALVLINLAVIDYSKAFGIATFVMLSPLYYISLIAFMSSKLD